MMEQMEKWAESDNHHIRRLASEGCRPRLPWAIALPEFKKNPEAVLKIINKLIYDDSEYVRRSVANNLNDISKDNPDIVINIAKEYLGKNKNTDKLIKHACRTLLKQGNSEVLKLFGYTEPDHITIKNFKIQKSVSIGNPLEFSFNLISSNSHLGKIRIEYAIDFLIKNGKHSRKIFKISEVESLGKKKKVKKQHSFKLITTRTYYQGTHGLSIIVNGQELIKNSFKLIN